MRAQCLTLAVVLLFLSGASASADDNNENARRGRTKGQGRGSGQQAPPQPGDLSTIDEANNLLVSGVEISAAAEEDGHKGTEYKPKIRGMLYDYQPILPLYDGQYLEEELPVPLTQPLGIKIEGDDEDSNDDDDALGFDFVPEPEVSGNSMANKEGGAENEETDDLNAGELGEESITVQEEELQSDDMNMPENYDAVNDDGIFDDAIDEEFDESTPQDASVDVSRKREEPKAASDNIDIPKDVANDVRDEDSNDEDNDAHAVDNLLVEEKEDVEEEQISSLAGNIVDAAMLLDEGAIESIAEELAEEVHENDIESSADMVGEESSASSVDNVANHFISEMDEQKESTKEEEKEQRNGSAGNSKNDLIEDGDAENVEESMLSQETDDETADDDESQAPTVSEVESPKASDNSYVAAEKSTMPQANGGGSDPSSASSNATALVDHNASEVKEPPEADDEKNASLATDDVEDGASSDGLNNAKASIDNDDRSTETVGIDVESDGPSAVLDEGTADARRIAEEKGVPTNIDNSDPLSPSDANATNGDSLSAEDVPAYELEGSSYNESLLVPRQDDEPTASKVTKDHASWRGVYDRELDDEETKKDDTESTNTGTETKRTDIDSLDNVREYVALKGEDISGAIPSEATPGVNNANIESDASEENFSDVDAISGVKSDEGGPSEGLATEASAATESMNDGTEEKSPDAQVSSNSEEEVDKHWSNEAEETSGEDSIDMNDLPGISSLRSSFSSSDVNSNFIDGIDDLDKFLEEVDTPDELDVAHGSSMQEVLVGKGVQILFKKVNAVVRRVKRIASKVKYRVANSMVAAKIREGIETSGIIALGEKVRESSNISEHKERVAGIGQKIGQVFDEKVDAMNKFFDDLMENEIAQSANKIMNRIKENALVRRIMSALGLSDEDEDDLMDFSSFSRMQQKGSGSDTDESLEDRLAAMRQMY